MQKKLGLKIKILKVLVWFALRCRLYYLWSRFYQCAFESKWDSVVLPQPLSTTEFENLIGSFGWREDTWYMLGDVISSPKAIYGRWLEKGAPQGDCDDHSYFAMHMIRSMSERGVLTGTTGIKIKVRDLFLLSVPFYGHNVGGHNVCVFNYRLNDFIRWAYVSNWYDGKIQWGYENLESIVKSVLRERISLGWAIADKNLRLVRYESGIAS